MRKLLTLSMALLLLSMISKAQLLNKLHPNNGFTESIAKVVENYQNNYLAIQGDSLPPDEDRDIFQSTIKVPGATECVIYRFHSEEDKTASWQALLYEGEDFKEASKVYKTAFKNLKQTKFKVGVSSYSFEGSMEDPTEALRFTSSILRPTNDSDLYKNFMAEIEIINTIVGWKVRLNLHSRKADTQRYQ